MQTVSAAEQAQDDAEKTGSIVLDEKTCTLMLSGNITAAEVQKYAKNEAVNAVVAAEGCVFPASCSGMFADFCAKSIDLSKADTSNVTDMSGMFSGCSSLTELDLSGFDTSNVTYMYNMFSGCSSLTELDLSSFNTPEVYDMSTMFKDDTNLKTIYVSDTWKLNRPKYSTEMFSGCEALTGGNGTVYNPQHVDGTYARIDTADAPGYLTFKEKPTPQADWGNANCRDGVDVSDAVLLARYSAEDSSALLTAQGKINADVTHDGKIDGDDVTLILKYIVKLVPHSALKPTAENK